MTYIQTIIQGCKTNEQIIKALKSRLSLIERKIGRALIEDSEGFNVSDEYLNRLDNCYQVIKEALDIAQGK